MNQEKIIYDAPQCEVIEMELQGMVAASSIPAPSWPPTEP